MLMRRVPLRERSRYARRKETATCETEPDCYSVWRRPDSDPREPREGALPGLTGFAWLIVAPLPASKRRRTIHDTCRILPPSKAAPSLTTASWKNWAAEEWA